MSAWRLGGLCDLCKVTHWVGDRSWTQPRAWASLPCPITQGSCPVAAVSGLCALGWACLRR